MLLFTKTAGFRHASISDAVQGIGQAGYARYWTVEHTEDAGRFTDSGLASLDVVVFLLTTGNVLDEPQQAALTSFVQAGGGWVGVHSASDTHYSWPWFHALAGAHFAGHWSIVETRLFVEDADHPSTRHLGSDWIRTDEWYSFDENPRPNVNVLLAIDEADYAQHNPPPELLMGDHPIAWYHEYDGGRALYTGGGHTSESYAEPEFVAHLVGGIEWAADYAPINP